MQRALPTRKRYLTSWRRLCRDTTPIPFNQSTDAYVESFHSSNGFSRERMEFDSAMAFDAAVREIAAPWCLDGIVHGEVVGTVIWGKPTPDQTSNAHSP